MTHHRSLSTPANLSEALIRIIEARHHDPFEVLGRHSKGDSTIVRAYLPTASTVSIAETGDFLSRIEGTDFFEGSFANNSLPDIYQLSWKDNDGVKWLDYDPYCFPPVVADVDMHWFAEGRHHHAHHFLGAHERTIQKIKGISFVVWAPNAERVSVVGDWNHWDGRRHSMRARGGSGIWELFIPGLGSDAHYKYEIRNRHSQQVFLKTDPYARRYELRPGTAALTTQANEYKWQDNQWMQNRREHDWLHEPMSTYEVHLGSWRRDESGQFLNYRELAKQLVEYVTELGFTHIELLPVTEHPLDASWGYQTTGYFAPTSRFGTPNDFRYFVDYCHLHNIGVLLDWAPGHFPKDDFALARFDGTPLYEHADPRLGEHRDWGTYIFNYGRNEVRNFLIASAMFWLEDMHLDGLRVDAVASMLYLDYSREENDWVPNKYGGRENLDAIHFLTHLNIVTHTEQPGTCIIAEESTSWPQVTRPVDMGGLGFSMKWNMGWMHDTLQYTSKNPIHRRYHHHDLTFGMLYAFTENFVLPFSHDEVVHGKGSMINKMSGDSWQRFANLRLLYTYQFTYPGKKLTFMGNEFAQYGEWNFDASLDWHLLDQAEHQGMNALIRDLNKLHSSQLALHYNDFSEQGFQWIDCDNADDSLLSYARKADDQLVVIQLNFTPVPRSGFRMGVPVAGRYRIIFNSDAEHYAGSNISIPEYHESEEISWNGQPASIMIDLPPLAGVILQLEI
ncbi:MAG: 1,4-alpha-glucan branching protein GlgB [Gammaproteobacteria bacterium]